MKLKLYRIHWEIDLSATSPLSAARQAQEIHRDHASIASVFEVSNEDSEWVVDLLAPQRKQVRTVQPRTAKRR